MKRLIIEIEEIGFPNSLIYRKDAPISEIINTEKLVEELNKQLTPPIAIGCDCMKERWEVREDGDRYCVKCGENKTKHLKS